MIIVIILREAICIEPRVCFYNSTSPAIHQYFDTIYLKWDASCGAIFITFAKVSDIFPYAAFQASMRLHLLHPLNPAVCYLDCDYDYAKETRYRRKSIGTVNGLRWQMANEQTSLF